MQKFNKLSVLLVLLATILTSCYTKTDDGLEYRKKSSPEYSDTLSDVSGTQDTTHVIDAFNNAYKIEKQFVDFLINRSIIDEGNLGTYYEEAPFVYYSLPASHEFSSQWDLRKYFRYVYYDVDQVVLELLEYPEYGPKALTIVDLGRIVISDNYRGKDDFNVDLDTVNIIDSSGDSATLEFLGFDGNVKAQIVMKNKKGKWVLEKSIFSTLLQAREEKLLSETNWADNLTDGAMNYGTAKRLYGETLVINVFVNDSEATFEDSDIDCVLNYVEEAICYLESEASRYGADIDIEYTDADSSLYFDSNDCIVDDFDYYHWTNNVFEEAGYGDLEGYILESFETSVLEEYDNYCILLHVNKPGRSYALQCNLEYDDKDLFFTERAVLFYSVDRNYKYSICPATYAHELLHLFGAIDLYYPNDTDDTRVELAESYFWWEIMRFVPHDDIERAAISKYTAFKIGLYPYLENQLKIFDD